MHLYSSTFLVSEFKEALQDARDVRSKSIDHSSLFRNSHVGSSTRELRDNGTPNDFLSSVNWDSSNVVKTLGNFKPSPPITD
jgi:hypothetical protein